jgi:hypothetical protein
MIRAGKYTVGGQEVEVKDMPGYRQCIQIGTDRVVFNENGYEIELPQYEPQARTTPEPAQQVEQQPEQRKGIFGSRTK